MENIILEHYKKYPLMKEEDFVKLIFQSCFGPKHMFSSSVDKMISYLLIERKDLVRKDSIIYEEIGNGYVRLFLESNIDDDRFIDLFIASIENLNNQKLFQDDIDLLKKLVSQNTIKLDIKRLDKIVNDILNNKQELCSHSKTYKEKYNPHYRVIKKDLLKSLL